MVLHLPIIWIENGSGIKHDSLLGPWLKVRGKSDTPSWRETSGNSIAGLF